MGAFKNQVERYLALFPAGQVLVAWMADWQDDPARFHPRLQDFLDIAHDPPPPFEKVNEARLWRIGWLATLLVNAPDWLVQLKGRTGLQGRGLAMPLRRLITRPGKVSHASEALRAEIRDFFATDNARLPDIVAKAGAGYEPTPAGELGR